ncbi:MAG: hypothetical protein M1826_003595, partial [Phylliscum demangeonii]
MAAQGDDYRRRREALLLRKIARQRHELATTEAKLEEKTTNTEEYKTALQVAASKASRLARLAADMARQGELELMFICLVKLQGSKTCSPY